MENGKQTPGRQELNYEAPRVEVLEVMVEKGFAVSMRGLDDAWGDGWSDESTL